mmetsp:Transcript_39949/g.94425  ORF Transcript_39949/g.94425 Transcript_39949/m.94425 type:complete len:344 (-) Transcript_39949:94-1125(-)
MERSESREAVSSLACPLGALAEHALERLEALIVGCRGLVLELHLVHPRLGLLAVRVARAVQERRAAALDISGPLLLAVLELVLGLLLLEEQPRVLLELVLLLDYGLGGGVLLQRLAQRGHQRVVGGDPVEELLLEVLHALHVGFKRLQPQRKLPLALLDHHRRHPPKRSHRHDRRRPHAREVRPTLLHRGLHKCGAVGRHHRKTLAGSVRGTRRHNPKHERQPDYQALGLARKATPEALLVHVQRVQRERRAGRAGLRAQPERSRVHGARQRRNAREAVARAHHREGDEGARSDRSRTHPGGLAQRTNLGKGDSGGRWRPTQDREFLLWRAHVPWRCWVRRGA